MDAKELINKLAQHPVVTSEMSLQMQLGFPYLDRQNGRLCISFKPHKEILNQDKIEYYAPEYEVMWVYPFQHMIRFENLWYGNKPDLSRPVGEIALDNLAGGGKYILDELYEECSRVISCQEETGEVSDVMLRRYQRTYYEAARQLQLTELYGEG